MIEHSDGIGTLFCERHELWLGYYYCCDDCTRDTRIAMITALMEMRRKSIISLEDQ